MEFKFRTKLKDYQDIDFYGFTKMIDKHHDYHNDIDILVSWSAEIYQREGQGITDIFPIIEKIALEYDYNYIEELPGDNYNEGERSYKLEVDDFINYPLSVQENTERKKLGLDERKWIVRTDYTPNESDSAPHLILTRIEIDWETKEITISF